MTPQQAAEQVITRKQVAEHFMGRGMSRVEAAGVILRGLLMPGDPELVTVIPFRPEFVAFLGSAHWLIITAEP
jgi:hypothetical protein